MLRLCIKFAGPIVSWDYSLGSFIWNSMVYVCQQTLYIVNDVRKDLRG